AVIGTSTAKLATSHLTPLQREDDPLLTDHRNVGGGEGLRELVQQVDVQSRESRRDVNVDRVHSLHQRVFATRCEGSLDMNFRPVYGTDTFAGGKMTGSGEAVQVLCQNGGHGGSARVRFPQR